MKIIDISKIAWQKGDEWFEKWYSTEICFRALNKGANPLYGIFTREGINSIAVNTQWFHESGSYDIWYQDLEKALVKDRLKVLSKVVFESEKFIKKVEKIIDDIGEVNLLDQTVFRKIKRGLNFLWLVFLVDLGKSLGPFIDRELKRKGLSENQIETVKNHYFLPKEKLLPQKEAESLKRIALYYKGKYKNKTFSFNNLPSNINKLLIKHWKKFRYLSCQDIDTNPYSVEDYFNNLRELLLVKKQGKTVPFLVDSEARKLLSKFDIKFLELVNKHLFLDNYTADLWARLDFQFMQLLSQKFGISFKELSWYSFQELEYLFREGKSLSETQLEERRDYRVMLQVNGKLNCFYGREDFEKVSSLVWANINQEDLSEFTGIVACRGEIRGLVKIVKGIKDIDKVNEGDILVSTTTRPDLMTAILRCSAIVTDSGGITSHAAIVSREFQIPCIVGTRVATQVLKDGDIVEVDANKGVVRKIA